MSDIATGLVEAWAGSRLTQATAAERDLVRWVVDVLGVESWYARSCQCATGDEDLHPGGDPR